MYHNFFPHFKSQKRLHFSPSFFPLLPTTNARAPRERGCPFVVYTKREAKHLAGENETMHEVAAECGEEEGEEASPLLTAATTKTTTTTGGGGEGEVQNEKEKYNNGALGGGNVNNGEEVELGSLQRTVNMFSRRLLRFSTATKLSMSSVSGATYLQQKLSTVEGTDEVRFSANVVGVFYFILFAFYPLLLPPQLSRRKFVEFCVC